MHCQSGLVHCTNCSYGSPKGVCHRTSSDVSAKSEWELVICIPGSRSGVAVNLPRCRTQVRISPPDTSWLQRERRHLTGLFFQSGSSLGLFVRKSSQVVSLPYQWMQCPFAAINPSDYCRRYSQLLNTVRDDWWFLDCRIL